jgi:hypothetical protein
MTRPLFALVVVAVLAPTACGGKQGEFATVVRCMQEHGARDATGADYTKLLPGRGWDVRRLFLGNDGLILVRAPTEAAARVAAQRVGNAGDTLGGPRLVDHRHGTLVYWWERPPSRSHRLIVDDCFV